MSNKIRGSYDNMTLSLIDETPQYDGVKISHIGNSCENIIQNMKNRYPIFDFKLINKSDLKMNS